MNNEELAHWGQSLYTELLAKYDTWSHAPLIKENGYALFYSPIHYEPDLMVIGYNPGYEEGLTRDKLHRDVPHTHDYFAGESYPLASKMKYIFRGDLLPFLKNSVKLNLFYFKSKDINQWHSEMDKVDPELRKEIEQYCFDKTLHIIETLKPKVVLAEGFGTFEKLAFGRGFKQVRVISHYYNQHPYKRIFLEAKIGSSRLLGISHPSGSRVSNEVWEVVRKKLWGFFIK